MDTKSKYGPNVIKLIMSFTAVEAVPSGGGIADGIKFFTDAEHRKMVLLRAENNALAAIQAIKNAPDNPFGDDEERIASEILKKVEEKKAEMRRRLDATDQT